MLERAGCQLVPGRRIPFVDHLPGDAIERDVAESLVESAQHDLVAPVGASGQSGAVRFAVSSEVFLGVFPEYGHGVGASLRWVDPLPDALVVERNEVVLLVEPLVCLRLVFQSEVPSDLLTRVERVDVSCLEAGRVAVRVPADDHRSPSPALFSSACFPLTSPWIGGIGPGAYRQREVPNEHHEPVDDDRPVG